MAKTLFAPNIESAQELRKWSEESTRRVNIENQADSTAATVSDLKDDFNSLLAKLKAAGIMYED